jgi:large subunit ribosomal protein L33
MAKEKREFVWMQCTSCAQKNYRTERPAKGGEKLKLSKYCKFERKHTIHEESRKK